MGRLRPPHNPSVVDSISTGPTVGNFTGPDSPLRLTTQWVANLECR